MNMATLEGSKQGNDIHYILSAIGTFTISCTTKHYMSWFSYYTSSYGVFAQVLTTSHCHKPFNSTRRERRLANHASLLLFAPLPLIAVNTTTLIIILLHLYSGTVIQVTQNKLPCYTITPYDAGNERFSLHVFKRIHATNGDGRVNG